MCSGRTTRSTRQLILNSLEILNSLHSVEIAHGLELVRDVQNLPLVRMVQRGQHSRPVHIEDGSDGPCPVAGVPSAKLRMADSEGIRLQTSD